MEELYVYRRDVTNWKAQIIIREKLKSSSKMNQRRMNTLVQIQVVKTEVFRI